MTDPQLPPPPDRDPAAADAPDPASQPAPEPAREPEPEVVDSFAAEPEPELPGESEPEVVDSFAAEPEPELPAESEPEVPGGAGPSAEAPAPQPVPTAAAAAPEVAATTAAPVAPAAAPGEPGPRTRGWLPLSALGAAVALALVATASLGWQVRQQARAEAAREQAPAAARDAGRLLFSYSHKTLQADFEKGLAVTTGRFREEYSRTTKEVVTPVAERYDAVVVADVVEAAVVDASPTEVTALLFLNQATTSTRVQGQQVDQSRVRMRLVERDGRWLVAEVSAL